MQPTPASLLEQLHNPAARDAWQRFVDLYTPLLFHWANRIGLQAQDAADLVQAVFLVLVRKLPEFTYDRHRSFRAWLRTVTFNKWRDHCKKRGGLPLASPGVCLDDIAEPDSHIEFWEAEYAECLVSRALEVMQQEF